MGFIRINILFIVLFVANVISASGQSLSNIEPKFGEFIDTPSVLLAWNSLDAALTYTVEVSKDFDFQSGVIQSTVLVQNNWLTPVLNFGTWYWRVIAATANGNVQSSTYKFSYYSPEANPYLSFWIHADSGIVLDGSNRIQSITDLSSNGYVLSQNNSSQRPYFVASGLNGLPSLNFQNAEVLEGGDILDIQQLDRSMIVVLNRTGSDNDFFISKSLQSSANSRYGVRYNGTNDLQFFYIDNTTHLATGSPSQPSSSYGLIHANVDRTSGQVSLLHNNQLVGTDILNISHTMNSDFRFLLGAYNDASDIEEVNHFNGNISEIVFIDNISSDQIDSVNYYLRDKYNPTLDLGPDVYVNKFCDTTLAVTSGYTNLIWSTGETTPTIDVNEGVYWVQGTDLFGYVHYDTIHVHYPKIPNPPTIGICDAGSITWNADLGPGFTYLWSTAETTPSIDISSAGTYSVEIFDSYGCSLNSGDTTFYIDYYSTTATLGNDTSLCSGNLLSLQVGAAETVAYIWPDLSTQPTYAVDTSGVYFVQATNVNGCIVQDSIQITITGVAPVAQFTPADVCYGSNSIFNDESTTEAGNPIINWLWDFGDANTDNSQNTAHLYSNAGYYFVELFITAQDGCTGYYGDSLLIRQNPLAVFSTTGHCENDSVYYSDQSLNGDGLINDWSWDFGQPSSGSNTSTLQNPTHLYAESNSFDVALVVTDDLGCFDDTTITIDVDLSPIADVTLNDDCLDQVLNLINNSTISNPDNISSYQWNFGDGTNSSVANPIKFYSAAGTYLVSLDITSNKGCTDNFSDTVLIHALPVPQFTVSNACVGTNANLLDLSTVQFSFIDSTRWIIDVFDTIYGSPSNYVFSTEGESFIKLTTISAFGCQKDTIKKVDIGPELDAQFTTLNSGLLVAGTPVSFVNQSVGGDAFIWDFDDMTGSTETSPIHQYDISYLDSIVTVQLITSNFWGCADTTSRDFQVTTAYLDLSMETLFLNESNGFYDVAVKMKNIGSVRIEGADIVLSLSNGTVLSEYFPDTLFSNQESTFFLASKPSSVFSNSNQDEAYICASAYPISSQGYTDIDWSNNQVCRNVQNENVVLIGPYPNPASDQISIGLLVPNSEQISLSIVDERGRIVAELYNQMTLEPGYHLEYIDITMFEFGMYFVNLTTENSRQIKKLVKF